MNNNTTSHSLFRVSRAAKINGLLSLLFRDPRLTKRDPEIMGVQGSV